MNTIACRSCGAKIGFIELPSGKKMPVDPELVKTYLHPTGVLSIVLVTERGEIRRGGEVSAIAPGAEPVEGYVSHFATCTDPKAHRQKGA